MGYLPTIATRTGLRGPVRQLLQRWIGPETATPKGHPQMAKVRKVRIFPRIMFIFLLSRTVHGFPLTVDRGFISAKLAMCLNRLRAAKPETGLVCL